MRWRDCDSCDKRTYTAENPFVECRVPRPSDRSDMCCVMAGHLWCFGPNRPASDLPQIGAEGGLATPEQWQAWIESKDADEAGFAFLG